MFILIPFQHYGTPLKKTNLNFEKTKTQTTMKPAVAVVYSNRGKQRQNKVA